MPGGRPKGAFADHDKEISKELNRRVLCAPAPELHDKLAIVADDTAAGIPVQMEALRRLFALWAARKFTERAVASPSDIA